MIPIIRLETFLHTKTVEIPQNSNLNACARLFITADKKHVIKLFDGTEHRYNSTSKIEFRGTGRKNLDNIGLLSKRQHDLDCSAFAVPEALISYHGTIVGYMMKYVDGVELDVAMKDNFFSLESKRKVFEDIAKSIIQLPRGIHIGDLHPHNIIVTAEGFPVFIDLDGFSVKEGWMLSCPLHDMNDLPDKYYDRRGGVIVSIDTDILCLFKLYFLYYFGCNNVLRYPISLISDRLPKYFSSIGADKRFVNSISRLFTNAPNIILPKMFAEIPYGFSTNDYDRFVEFSGLRNEEKKQTMR